MDTQQQPTQPGVMVFKCELVHTKLSLVQCSTNWAQANGRAEPQRNGLGPKRYAMQECTECPRGREHFETGKFQSGLRIEALVPGGASKPVIETKVEYNEPSPIEDMARLFKERHAELVKENRDISAEGRVELTGFINQFCALSSPFDLAQRTGFSLDTIRAWRNGSYMSHVTDKLKNEDIRALASRIYELKKQYARPVLFPDDVKWEIKALVLPGVQLWKLADALGLTVPGIKELVAERPPRTPEQEQAMLLAANDVKTTVNRLKGVKRTHEENVELRTAIETFVTTHGTLIELASLIGASEPAVRTWRSYTATTELPEEFNTEEVRGLRKEIADAQVVGAYEPELKRRVVEFRMRFTAANKVASILGLNQGTLSKWVDDYKLRMSVGKDPTQPRRAHIPDSSPVGTLKGVELTSPLEEEPKEVATKNLVVEVPADVDQTPLSPLDFDTRMAVRESAKKTVISVHQDLWLREGRFKATVTVPSNLTKEEAEKLKTLIDLMVV